MDLSCYSSGRSDRLFRAVPGHVQRASIEAQARPGYRAHAARSPIITGLGPCSSRAKLGRAWGPMGMGQMANYSLGQAKYTMKAEWRPTTAVRGQWVTCFCAPCMLCSLLCSWKKDELHKKKKLKARRSEPLPQITRNG